MMPYLRLDEELSESFDEQVNEQDEAWKPEEEPAEGPYS